MIGVIWFLIILLSIEHLALYVVDLIVLDQLFHYTSIVLCNYKAPKFSVTFLDSCEASTDHICL